MTDHQRPEVVQINLATDQRNAARDYHEIRMPDSIKVYLATMPSEQLDREAVDNERLFTYRFGFDAPRVVREKIIAIKQQHDFTDYNIRWLRRSGQINIKRTEVTLAPSRSMVVIGWVQLTIFSLVCLAGLFQVVFSSAPAWKQALGQLAVAAVWLASAWVIHRLYIAPWRMLQRAGVK